MQTRFVQALFLVVLASTVGSVSDGVAQTPGNREVRGAEPAGLPFLPAGANAPVVPVRDEFSGEPALKATEKPVSVPRCFEILADLTQTRIENPEAQIAGKSAAATADLLVADKLGTGSTQAEPIGGFQWGGAIRQSMFFLGILNLGRMAEEESREGLRGPFFNDYFATVKSLRGWRDGDSFLVNYVAHPMQGAISGFVQIHNDPKARPMEFGESKAYWQSRLKAMGWAALFSTQFELGPISEASLGNVGLKQRDNTKHPMAWVDLIVTPTVGTAWLVGEDALDRYVVRRVERNVSNRLVRVLVRSFLNPSRSMSNVLRLKYPWYRDSRQLQL